MCLISIAPEGVDKYTDHFKNIIKNGMYSHSNGTGFAYIRKNSDVVKWKKGYNGLLNDTTLSEFDSLWTDLKALDLKNDDILIIHSRTATVGKTSRNNCHPFLLSPFVHRSIDEISELSGETREGVLFHNGGFSGGYKDASNIHSDTAHFTSEVFSGIPETFELLLNRPLRFATLFKAAICGSRIAFLNPKKGILKIGDFVTDNLGYLHSNNGFNPGNTQRNVSNNVSSNINYRDSHCGYGIFPEINVEKIDTVKFSPLLPEDKEEPKNKKREIDLPEEYLKIYTHNLFSDIQSYYDTLKFLFLVDPVMIEKFVIFPKVEYFNGFSRFDKVLPSVIRGSLNKRIALSSPKLVKVCDMEEIINGMKNLVILPNVDIKDDMINLIRMVKNSNKENNYLRYVNNVLKTNLNTRKQINIKKPFKGTVSRYVLEKYQEIFEDNGLLDECLMRKNDQLNRIMV